MRGLDETGACANYVETEQVRKNSGRDTISCRDFFPTPLIYSIKYVQTKEIYKKNLTLKVYDVAKNHEFVSFSKCEIIYCTVNVKRGWQFFCSSF